MSIIPEHVHYPRTFVSRQSYFLFDELWKSDTDDSDVPLNKQLVDFVKDTGAAITQVSAPNVNMWEDKKDDTPERRVYITSVSVLYVPSVDGSEDVDTKVATGSRVEPAGTVSAKPNESDKEQDKPRDSGRRLA